MGNIFILCHGLNDKGLHDFEKLLLANYWGAAAPPGCYGPVYMLLD
jgi:hypothetical protein